jgi:hypothetical protein
VMWAAPVLQRSVHPESRTSFGSQPARNLSPFTFHLSHSSA